MSKKLMALLLALIMCLSLWPVTAFASNAKWNALSGDMVKTATKYTQEFIVEDSDNNDLYSVKDDVDGTRIIKLRADFMNGDTTLTVASGTSVILDLNGKVLQGSGTGSVIKVESGATLTLKDSSATTKHYFSVDETGLWTLLETERPGCMTVLGGVITGGNASDGGGVYVEGTFAMNGGNIVGNTATENGGGVYVHQFFNNATFVMEGGTITGNTASGGGGVYVSEEEMCLAAGTPITLADGTRTVIENLKKGDMVRVFDHESGEISSAKLFSLWKYPTKQSGAFTLHFTNGIDVTAVGGHCFFDRAEKQYAAINIENVNDYIGHQFYNADDGRWETLTGVTFLTEAVDTYIIVSEKHLNVVAGGMLSNEDGIYTLMCNVFAFGENLTIDAAAKAEDIAQYGLWGYENMQYFSRYAYDALNLQYMSVLFGRGIFTPEEFAELEAYSAGIDPELYCSGKEAENAPPQKAEAKESLLTKVVSFLTAPFVKVAYAEDLPILDPGVYFGGTAWVVGNKAGNKDNNVYLCSTEMITLGTGKGENGVAVPIGIFSVGVTMQANGQFTTNGTASDTDYFFSDDSTCKVIYNSSGYLELVKTYTVTFNANGHGTPPTSYTSIDFGSTISKPTDPTAAGYTFGGWYRETGCTNEWNFTSDTVTTDTTLYAKWTATGGNHHHSSTITTPTVTSAATADMGVAIYGVLSVSSLLGMGWVAKRKH